jgi:hypothetical protein
MFNIPLPPPPISSNPHRALRRLIFMISVVQLFEIIMIHWFWIFKSSRIREPASSVPEFLLKIIRIRESFFLVISNP